MRLKPAMKRKMRQERDAAEKELKAIEGRMKTLEDGLVKSIMTERAKTLREIKRRCEACVGPR